MFSHPRLGWAAACLWRSRGRWRRRRWGGRGTGYRGRGEGGSQPHLLTLRVSSSARGARPLSSHFSTVTGVWGGEEEARGRIGSVKKVETRWRRVERRWRRWVNLFLSSWYFINLCFEGEEGVGRVGKPNREQGVHREEIFQEVTCVHLTSYYMEAT